MSPTAISDQLQTIERISAKATQSKESAIAFLTAAGLIQREINKKPKETNEKK